MPVSVTPQQAADELRARGHTPEDVKTLSGGMWSAAFAFRESARDYVVRFHDRRDDLEKDRFAERWRSGALRIPHITEIGDYGEGGYAIAERVEGREIDDLDAAGMRRVLPSLFGALDAMRDADLRGTSGWGLWHGDGNAQAASWRDLFVAHFADRALIGSHPQIIEAFDAGVARMRELLEFAPDDRYLVHNDLLYHNVRHDDRGVILLDWGASIYGDFLYDCALLTFWWPWYGQWSSIDIDALVREHFARGVANFAERLRLCELDIGIEHIPFQLKYRDEHAASWTARRLAERARAPL